MILIDGVCVNCGHTVDEVARMTAINAHHDEFCRGHTRAHCPFCRKRVSPRYDTVNAADDVVEFGCPHCGKRWEIDR